MTKHYSAYHFVKEHGLEKARDILKAIPENQHWHSSVMMNETGKWVVMQAPELIHESGKKYVSTFRMCDEYKQNFTKLDELKQAIADYELVNIHGFERSKQILKDAPPDAECFSWALGDSGIRDKTVVLVDLKAAVDRIEQGESA